MGRKNGDDGSKTDPQKPRVTGNVRRISDYAAGFLPKGSVINFVFYEDINSDNINEAIIGFTHFTPFPPESAVMLLQDNPEGLKHSWLSTSCGEPLPEYSGLFDNAVIADTDGDGKPELVLSLSYGQEHDISVSVFDWRDGEFQQIWKSECGFYHGSMEVIDIDGDGVSEVIIECGTHAGHEIIETGDTCYRVREAFYFKWDGSDYLKKPCKVRMPYESYNMSVEFLRAIWKREYRKAFDMVVMPGFLGLSGLDDSSLSAFRSYAAKKLRPALQRNLSNGRLMPLEPYDSCCQFIGYEDCFTVELVRVNGVLKIYELEIARKST